MCQDLAGRMTTGHTGKTKDIPHHGQQNIDCITENVESALSME